MENDANRKAVEGLFSGDKATLSVEDEYNLRSKDYVMEMPQSGERIVGRDKMREFQEAYPNPPDIQLRRIVGSSDLFIVEAKSDYGKQVSYVTNIIEFKDGKIMRETRYYAEPFDPPQWRAQWVEVDKDA